MNRIFISKKEGFILNLNQLSYMNVDRYGNRSVYVVGDTRPQPVSAELYEEILNFIKLCNTPA